MCYWPKIGMRSMLFERQNRLNVKITDDIFCFFLEIRRTQTFFTKLAKRPTTQFSSYKEELGSWLVKTALFSWPALSCFSGKLFSAVSFFLQLIVPNFFEI